MLQNRIEWLRQNVFPEAVQTRSFGADVKEFVSFEPNDKKATDQFCSDVIFGDVTIEKKDEQLVTESVVIKVHPTLEKTRESVDCDAMFYNEILFYSEIIPLFKKYDTYNILSTSFCEFVYGNATDGQNPEEDVIILKNLHERNFKLTVERLFIDERHVKLALEKIAKFHALSFKCQSDDPASFHDVVSKIKNPLIKLDEEMFPANLMTRGIDYLQNDPQYKDRLSGIYKCSEGVKDFFEKCMKPSGPLNVITHGDFNRNNMMFQYGRSGEPLDVIFFDMALIKYCSPVIDPSYVLTLNTSPETKRLHWDDFVRTYYNSLSKQLDGHPAEPSFEDILLELRSKGVVYYYVCAYALPLFMDFKSREEMEESSSRDKLMQNFKETGDSKVTEYLAEIIKHMLDRDYIFEN